MHLKANKVRPTCFEIRHCCGIVDAVDQEGVSLGGGGQDSYNQHQDGQVGTSLGHNGHNLWQPTLHPPQESVTGRTREDTHSLGLVG